MNLKSKILFYHNLRSMLHAGMDFLKATQLLSNQKQDHDTSEVLDILKTGIRRGETVYDVVAANPRHFSEFEREMFGVGERSGLYDGPIRLLEEYFESQLAFKNEFVSAMLYPVFLLHFVFLVTPLMSILFLPSYSVGQFFLTLAKVVLYVDILPLTVWRVIQIESINEAVMSLLVKIPILVKFDITKFILSLKSMYSAGADIGASLEASAGLCSNRVMREECLSMADMVRRGETLTESFSRSSMFPAMVVNMIETGERSGTVEGTLGKIADNYLEDLRRAMARFKDVFPKVIYALILVVVASQVVGQYSDSLSVYDALEDF